jgi:hypothetical protein
MVSTFEPWLAARLNKLGTDETVFVPYILSILQVLVLLLREVLVLVLITSSW